MRILYLTRELQSSAGHEGFGGRRLFDALAREGEASMVRHQVLESLENIPETTLPECMNVDQFLDFRPSLVFLERGLFTGAGRSAPSPHNWKIPRSLLESWVAAGRVAIVSDVGADLLRTFQGAFYRASSDLFAAQIAEHDGEPVGLFDRNSGSYTLTCHPKKMAGVDEWLKPVYAGIDAVTVASPVRLKHAQAFLATGDDGEVEEHAAGEVVEDNSFAQFASVRKLGYGFIVLIAGGVSSDNLIARSPDNLKWLVQTACFLHTEAGAERRRYNAS